MIAMEYIIGILSLIIIFAIIFPFVLIPAKQAEVDHYYNIANQYCINESFFNKNFKFCDKYSVYPTNIQAFNNTGVDR